MWRGSGAFRSVVMTVAHWSRSSTPKMSSAGACTLKDHSRCRSSSPATRGCSSGGTRHRGPGRATTRDGARPPTTGTSGSIGSTHDNFAPGKANRRWARLLSVASRSSGRGRIPVGGAMVERGTSRMGHQSRLAACAWGAAVVLALTACGSRLSYERLQADAGVPVQSAAATAAGGDREGPVADATPVPGDGVTGPTTEVGGVDETPGGGDPAPGAPGRGRAVLALPRPGALPLPPLRPRELKEPGPPGEEPRRRPVTADRRRPRLPGRQAAAKPPAALRQGQRQHRARGESRH